jgi:hypothetical protein
MSEEDLRKDANSLRCLMKYFHTDSWELGRENVTNWLATERGHLTYDSTFLIRNYHLLKKLISKRN